MTDQVSLNSREGRGILLATILPSAMAIIFGTAITIALPAIQEYFQTDFAGIQWIVTAYTLTLGVLILISGALGDMFGRKRVFVTGIAIFMIGSLISGFVQAIIPLIVLQVIIGIGAAMTIPGSMAIINTCINDKQRGRAIGLWTGFITGGAVVAPFLGGSLVEAFNWQAVFFSNVIIGLLALLVATRFIPKDEGLRSRTLDWLGIILIGVGLFGVSFGLIQGSTLSLVLGLGLLPLFAIRETRASHPLVPPDMFKSSLVTGANLATLFLYTALNGLIFYLILNFQQVHNFSPLQTGLAFMPAPLIITILAGPFGSLADKIGPRIPMMVGPALVSVAFFLLAFTGPDSNYFTRFLPGLVLHGIGMAVTVAPLTKSALAVPAKYSGAASGVNNAIARIAAPLAIAVFGLLVKDSLADGFRIIMAIGAGLALISVATSYFTIKNTQAT
ncbi:MAG: MFS transporter [Candidatus Andersenbacteria bacterium]